MCPLPEDLCPESRKGVDQIQPCVSSGDMETRAQPMSIRLNSAGGTGPLLVPPGHSASS